MNHTKTVCGILRIAAGSLLAACLLAPAWAQSVYKSTRADGSVVYGDAPLPDAAKVEQYLLAPVQVPTPADKARAARQRSHDERAVRDVDERLRKRKAAIETADNEVNSALAALERAKKRAQNDEEPQPGERSRNATGSSRLNETYWGRVQDLELAVAQAERRLNAAYAARNNLRD